MVEMKLGGETLIISPSKIINTVKDEAVNTVTMKDIIGNKYILTQTQWNYFLGASGKSFCKFNEKEFIELGGTKEEIDNGGSYIEGTSDSGGTTDPPVDELATPFMDNLVTWYEFLEPNNENINVVKSLVGGDTKNLTIENCLHTEDNGFNYNGFFFGTGFKTSLRSTGDVFKELLVSKRGTIIAFYKDDIYRYEGILPPQSLNPGIENDVFSTFSFLNIKVFDRATNIRKDHVFNDYLTPTRSLYKDSLTLSAANIANYNSSEYVDVSYTMNLHTNKNIVQYYGEELNPNYKNDNLVPNLNHSPSTISFRIGNKDNLNRNKLTLGAIFIYDTDLTDEQKIKTVNYFRNRLKNLPKCTNEPNINDIVYGIYNVSDMTEDEKLHSVINTSETLALAKITAVSATPIERLTFKDYINKLYNDNDWMSLLPLEEVN
ncbi:MAG: hypothetical protein ACRC92_20665 [Peptostreptococcaceae bacterium]